MTIGAWARLSADLRAFHPNLALVTVVIVTFEEGKIHHEHIHWDQASALVQLGLLDPANLPVSGAEAARKALDPAAVPSNLLMKRTTTDELL